MVLVVAIRVLLTRVLLTGTFDRAAGVLAALVIAILCSGSIPAQEVSSSVPGNTGRTERASEVGVLLLAHGGSQGWNDEVNNLARSVNQTVPVEVAFGMATKRNIQEAINRLTARGVREIVAAPLFVSSHSSVITATQYLLGVRDTAPPELAIFAKMSHNHGAPESHNHDHHAQSDQAATDPTTPVKSPVPIRWTGALDRDPVVADILLARAVKISQTPAREVVIVVAHGPVSDEENTKWLADMGSLVERMRRSSNFKRIEYLTVRDDAPEPIRTQATAEFRRVVERASTEGSRVLIVPLLLSYGGIEKGIRKRLEGLDYTMSTQALLPDDRLIQWTRLAVERRSK